VENIRVGNRSGLHPLGCPKPWRRRRVAGAVFQYCGSALLDLRMATRCCPQQGCHVVATPGRKFLPPGVCCVEKFCSFPSPLSCVRKCSGIIRNRTRLLDCLAQETSYLRHSHQRAAFETPMDFVHRHRTSLRGPLSLRGYSESSSSAFAHCASADSQPSRWSGQVIARPIRRKSRASRRGNVCDLEEPSRPISGDRIQKLHPYPFRTGCPGSALVSCCD
jgi:hypothetical protein